MINNNDNNAIGDDDVNQSDNDAISYIKNANDEIWSNLHNDALIGSNPDASYHGW